MDNQTALAILNLLSLTSKLVATIAITLVIGLVVLGWELWGITRALHQIAQMTAEVLRRTPER
jgi:hypothetical protein